MIPKKKSPAAKIRAAAGGRKARANGLKFEDFIESILRPLRAKGLAVIEKTPEPMKPLKVMPGNKFLACYTKAAQPDFKGVVKGGRAVVFEAKSTALPYIARNRVTEEQSAALTEYEAAGAICFVLVSYKNEKFYKIPWPAFRDMEKALNKKRMNLTDLEQYQLVQIHLFMSEYIGGCPIDNSAKSQREKIAIENGLQLDRERTAPPPAEVQKIAGKNSSQPAPAAGSPGTKKTPAPNIEAGYMAFTTKPAQPSCSTCANCQELTTRTGNIRYCQELERNLPPGIKGCEMYTRRQK